MNPSDPEEIHPAWGALRALAAQARPGWDPAETDRAVDAAIAAGMPFARALCRLAGIIARPDGHPSELGDEVRGLRLPAPRGPQSGLDPGVRAALLEDLAGRGPGGREPDRF